MLPGLSGQACLEAFRRGEMIRLDLEPERLDHAGHGLVEGRREHDLECSGPAEDALLASSMGLATLDPVLTLADRFEAAPGRIISVYLRTP